MAVTSCLSKQSLDTSPTLVKWGQRASVHVKNKSMGTRKKCEHGIFIGSDDKVKGHRVFIKHAKKILVSQHVRSINSTKKGID